MSKMEAKFKRLQVLLDSIPANMYFKDEVSLILYLEPLMNLDRTNLKRTVGYYNIILKFLSKQKGAASFVNDEDAEKYILRTKLMAAQLEISQQKKDILRLNKTISSILSPNQQHHSTDIPASEDKEDVKGNYNLQLTQAAMAFFTVLKWVNDRNLGLSPNYVEKIVEDLACSNNNERIVVTRDRAKFYFEFWQKNKDLLNSMWE